VQARVHGGQCRDVDGQDLRVVVITLQVRRRAYLAGLVGGQAQVFGEPVTGLVEEVGPHARFGGQRQQWMGVGHRVDGVADPGGKAVPPVSGGPGEQQNAHGRTGAVQERVAQKCVEVPRGPALGVVHHQQEPGPSGGRGAVLDGVGAHLVDDGLPRRPPRVAGQFDEVGGQAGLALSAGSVHQTHRETLRRIVTPGRQRPEIRVAAREGHHLVGGPQQPGRLLGQPTRSYGGRCDGKVLDPVRRSRLVGVLDVLRVVVADL
jgi:hypothetical protein